MELFLGPITLPGPLKFGSEAERQVSRGILWFRKRCAALLQAAGLLDASGEPGLVLPADRAQARRMGELAAEALPKTMLPGRAEIGYLRSVTADGVTVKSIPCGKAAILEDICGLGNDFLCALVLHALEKGHRVQLCPSLTDPGRLEGVLLPEHGMAWVSDRIGLSGTVISLDEIPDPERRLALKEAIKQDRVFQETLIRQAEEQIKMAGILYRVIE